MRAGLTVAVAVLCAWLPGSAIAGSFRAAPAPRPESPSLLGCLQSSADATLVSWRDRDRTIRAGSWPGGTVRVGSFGDCPVAAAVADGSAALAVAGQLAVRPAGGRFSPFNQFAREEDGIGLSLGGGVVAIGATRSEGDGVAALLIVRGAGGAERTVTLPGGMGAARTVDQVVGPLTALDGTGRGLVIWGGAREARGQLLASRFDGSGALGPVQVLAPGGADTLFGPPSITMDSGGRAAVGWVAGARTTVVTGTAAGGFHLATAETVALGWRVSVAADGAAIAVGSRSAVVGNRVVDRLVVATRAAGGPFSARRGYSAEGVGDQQPAMAIDRGRYLVAFAAEPTVGSSSPGRLQAVTGRAGRHAGAAIDVPIASAEVLDFAAALPAGRPPVVLTLTRRTRRYGIAAFFYSRRPPRVPRGITVRAAGTQRLGDPQAIRVAVTCPRRCAVRVAGQLTSGDGLFDASRTLRAGATIVRVPLDRDAPLREGATAELEIAVDDATGELRTTATVSVGP